MPGELERFRMVIGGKPVDAASGRTFESQNPYDGAPWATLADGGPEDIDAAVGAARAAFDGEWGQMTGFARAAIMRSCAAAIAANAPQRTAAATHVAPSPHSYHSCPRLR